jgi:hypothetical protein
MNDKLTEIHNRLTREFITKMVKENEAAGGGYSDLLVLYESLSMGVMMALQRVYNVKPNTAAMLADEAVVLAMERFAAKRNPDAKK